MTGLLPLVWIVSIGWYDNHRHFCPKGSKSYEWKRRISSFKLCVRVHNVLGFIKGGTLCPWASPSLLTAIIFMASNSFWSYDWLLVCSLPIEDRTGRRFFCNCICLSQNTNHIWPSTGLGWKAPTFQAYIGLGIYPENIFFYRRGAQYGGELFFKKSSLIVLISNSSDVPVVVWSSIR